MKRIQKYALLLPISLSLAILVLSLTPLPALPETKFIASDKLLHFVAFAILTLSYLWAFGQKGMAMPKRIILSAGISAVIGALVELLQSILPVNRFGDIWDFIFDILGILMITLIYFMMRRKKMGLGVVFLLLSCTLSAQSLEESKAFQDELNREYADPEHSPLEESDRLSFEALSFFDLDSSYIVKASIERSQLPSFFEMETTTDRRPEYRVWATAHFSLHGERYSLVIYQNKKLMQDLEYSDYLFLPFTDNTNGETSYGGGRYLDLRITEKDEIWIDFNKAYNPYCAYNKKYSCPIVPKENHLDTSVRAGVKKFH